MPSTGPGDRVTLDELPPRTSIRFSGYMPPETRPEDIGVKFTGRRRKKKRRK